MTATTLLLVSWAALAPLFAALWLTQIRSRDASHVDVGWALGLGALALACAAVLPGEPARRVLVGAMGASWSLRLSAHLYFDRVRGKPEDGRYAAMAPSDWRVWLSPALILFLILKVSGIPATEEQALKSRGDDYREYRRTTSMFVPWFPRRNS